MNMTKIVCPKCGAEARLSLVDTSYSGPRRCWKCHEYFTITIENNCVTSCEPLSQAEFEKQQAAKKTTEKSRNGIEFSGNENRQTSFDFAARDNSQGGIEFAEQNKTEEVEKPMDTLWKNLKSFVPKEPPVQPDPPKTNPVYPSEKFRIFVPLEETQEQPEPPKTKKRDDLTPSNHREPSHQTDSDGPVTIFPPDRPRTFVPLEDTEKKKPQK
jgi:hypothetical protein